MSPLPLSINSGGGGEGREREGRGEWEGGYQGFIPGRLREPCCRDTRSDHRVFSQAEAPDALVLP